MTPAKNQIGILALALIGLLGAESSYGDMSKSPTATRGALLNQNLTTSQSRSPVDPTWSFSAAEKNWVWAGRQEQLEEIGGHEYTMKNELVLGVAHKTGWGLKATGSYYTNQDDEADTKSNVGDPTAILVHPDFYKSLNTEVGGYFRVYFPVSPSSQAKSRYQYAYYLTYDHKMAHGWDITAYATGRYFNQPAYSDSDMYFYFESEPDIEKSIVSWMKIGVGPYFQSESHITKPAGTNIDISPYLSFEFDHLVIQPRLNFPIYVVDDVDYGNGENNTALSDMAASIYVKLSI